MNTKNGSKILKLVKKYKKSGVLFHELIVTYAQLNEDTLLNFDSDDDTYEEHINEVFNQYNQDIQNEIFAKENYSTTELTHFNCVLREATDSVFGANHGSDILEDKNFHQQIELYIYLEAKNILTDMRTEFIDAEIKTKKKKEETDNAAATIALLRRELNDLRNNWEPTGFNYLSLVTTTIEKERLRIKELIG